LIKVFSQHEYIICIW